MRRILLMLMVALIVAALAVVQATLAFADLPSEVCIKQYEAGRNVPTACRPFAG